MYALEAFEEAELALIQIYKTADIYGHLPCNKTVDISEVCAQIAKLRSIKGDTQEAIFFYQEALKSAHGENYKKELQYNIEALQNLEKAIPSASVQDRRLDREESAGRQA